MIRRLPRVGDLVWVGADMRAEWREGRVVLSVISASDHVGYVVRLEVPSPEGARLVRAAASDLTIFPEY